MSEEKCTSDSLMAKAWSSEELKKQQTSLRRTANAMEKHRRELSQYVSIDELSDIDKAVATFRAFEVKVRHAKEKKIRQEREAKARRDRVERELKVVIEKHFSELSLLDQAIFCCSYPYSVDWVDDMLVTIEKFGISKLKDRVKNTFSSWWLSKYLQEFSYKFSRLDGEFGKLDLNEVVIKETIEKFNRNGPAVKSGRPDEVIRALRSAINFSESLPSFVA
ncbi:hypothetical protein HBA55_34745 [Pseudomaricurvus alkylphenolicus]|uniref:hypothetical protein n=1 Tax=Pseudomaricurvus alkylphenolicus TaxID=1306991 RepID=UPI00141DCE4C|nr:hypothetical protein [Pseudomaricurvus alkylphenolicus]NIB44791.1 hypothetical protein [Pseudomaricurvus alkylphenolicus]